MKQTTNDLTRGSIPGKIIQFAIPIFFGNLFQQLYNTFDAYIVGRYLGKGELAAVTSTGSLIFLLLGFFSGTAMGAGVVIAKLFGAKDYGMLRKAVHTAIAFGILAGILMMVTGVVFTPQILQLMGTPEKVFGLSASYLRVFFFGAVFTVMYNVCTGILQAVGDSKSPLIFLVISSVTNIVLDYIFCAIFKLPVAFAALATILSQAISACLCMYRLMRTKDVYQVHIKEIGFDSDIIKKMLRIGLPSGLQNSIISIANIVVQTNINSFGEDAMAGCGAYWKIEGFGFLPITCFAMAMTTFIGQNIGAKEVDRVKKGARFGIICSISMAELIGLLIYIFIPYLIAIFNDSPKVIEFGVTHARTVTLFYFLLAFSHTVAGIMRGAGKSVVPMYVMLAFWCVFRIGYIITIRHFVEGIRIVLCAYPITWSLSSIVFLGYLLSGKWLRSAITVEA